MMEGSWMDIVLNITFNSFIQITVCFKWLTFLLADVIVGIMIQNGYHKNT